MMKTIYQQALFNSKRPWLEVYDSILAAYCLIYNEENWTRNAEARNAANQPVNTFCEDAVKFCASGALLREYMRKFDFLKDDYDLQCKYSKLMTYYMVDYFNNNYRARLHEINDTHSHNYMVDIFDKMLADVKKIINQQ